MAVVSALPAAAIPGKGVWIARTNGAADDGDQGNAVVVSRDGSTVFVTGASYATNRTTDYLTYAYKAATGAGVWSRTYNGPGDRHDAALAIALSPDGNTVFVTGSSARSLDTGGNLDYLTYAYDATTGAGLWRARYNGTANGDDVATAIAVSPDGGTVFVTGSSGGIGGGGNDYVTYAYNAATGAGLWNRRYNGTGKSDDGASGIVVTPDGSRVIVTGHSVGTSDDYVTYAYNAHTGAGVWLARYNGTGSGRDLANAIAISPDGSRVFVTGSSVGMGSGSDYLTYAYDAVTGAGLWSRRYNGTANNSDTASAVAVSPDGTKVFVTGSSTGSATGSDYVSYAYDAATGVGLWIARYNGTGNSYDFGHAVAASPDGSKVFVTGTSVGITGNFDYLTYAYDAATGAGRWSRDYNGTGDYDDFAEAVAVSPDSSQVFVTGFSGGASGLSDMLTYAYSAN